MTLKNLFWAINSFIKFYNKLNKNPYLIGCKNCIIDIKNKEHRKGIH